MSKSTSRTPYINASAVRELALRICRDNRRPFTRVSAEFLEGINAAVAETVGIRVHRAPSVGRTLK